VPAQETAFGKLLTVFGLNFHNNACDTAALYDVKRTETGSADDISADGSSVFDKGRACGRYSAIPRDRACIQHRRFKRACPGCDCGHIANGASRGPEINVISISAVDCGTALGPAAQNHGLSIAGQADSGGTRSALRGHAVSGQN